MTAVSLLGKISLSILFLFSAVTKILNFPAAVHEMAGHHLPFPAVVAVAVIVIQIIGPALLFTASYAWVGGAILAAFTILATLIGHGPWGGNPPTLELPQFVLMMMNLSITGGFLSVVAQRRTR